MKSKLMVLLIFMAAILAIIGVFMPIYVGTRSGYDYSFYSLGVYIRNQISTGDLRTYENRSWGPISALVIAYILAGVAYCLATLFPKIKAGRLNVIAGILLCMGGIMQFTIVNDILEVYEVSSGVTVNSFASFQPIAGILVIIAAALAMIAGILARKENRKAAKTAAT